MLEWAKALRDAEILLISVISSFFEHHIAPDDCCALWFRSSTHQALQLNTTDSGFDSWVAIEDYRVSNTLEISASLHNRRPRFGSSWRSAYFQAAGVYPSWAVAIVPVEFSHRPESRL